MDWKTAAQWGYYLVASAFLFFSLFALLAARWQPAAISLAIAAPGVVWFLYRRVYMPGPILP